MYFASKYIIQEYVMCAIMGILENNVNIEALKRMAKVLRHRGPDDTGEYMTRLFDAEDENVAVAHNRLSIRDLSSNGHQPMINDQGNVIITFNGEIYNAEDYRAELEKKGYTFKGTSDTEIMLNLYVEYGIDGLLERIDGMYAICIIDKKDDCIYLIRDRIGEKPLYFYKNANTLIWASEYKAFYEHPSFKVELDEDALSEYIMFRYVSGGHTLLRNVTNLEPGTYMQIKRGEIHKVKYRNYPVGNTSKNHYVDDVENWFKDRLRNAVNSRLVSDVEVGVQLSGGVDSSCITHMISEKRNELQTFGMVFGDRSYSEQKYMEKVVAVCNTKSHMYEFPNELFLKNWMMTTYFFEAPMNHEGTVALMHLNKKASEYVKVLLCGEGSDESLGGYKRFYDNLKERVDRVYKCRELIRKLIRRGTGDMDSLLNRYEKSFVRETQLKKFTET